MRNKGNMTQLDLYKVSEELKDRYSYLFMVSSELKLSQKAMEESAPLIARVIDNYNRRVEEAGPQEGIMYLVDTLGFYLMLCTDMGDTNQELLAHLKEITGHDDDN